MEYPVIIDGRTAGTVTDSTEGLFREFRAEIPGGGGLLRLSVYGGGREGYLGVMEPCEGGLALKRRLSKRSLEGFPECPEYAGPAGMQPQESAAEGAAPPALEKAPEQVKPPEQVKSPEPAELPETVSPPVGEDAGDLLWFKRPDGSLVAHDGASGLVALPARLRSEPDGAVLREIGGGKYMVFRY